MLRYLPYTVVVEVSDDGAAASRSSAAGSQLGFVGIRERAALFGGRLEAGPAEAGGWVLRAEFPG